jgi:hypothetical protein
MYIYMYVCMYLCMYGTNYQTYLPLPQTPRSLQRRYTLVGLLFRPRSGIGDPQRAVFVGGDTKYIINVKQSKASNELEKRRKKIQMFFRCSEREI